ncbi:MULTISPECIES: RHS repeat domain-containing protein [unclassified Pseudoalteromonas]|uniref:RHS repeat domain-containing protein n=1 Tax=unclassified Pseudoalteromonas TaxID=194690 RepID=UPI0030157455
MYQSLTVVFIDQSKVYYSPNGYGEPTKAVEIDKSGSIVNKFATEAKYYAHGMLESFTFGNNATHSMSIDPISLMPKTIKDTLNNNDVVNLTYGFDNNGNVTKIIDMVQPGFSLTSLVYDDLNRLTNVYGGNLIGKSTITYDGLGNIETYKSKDTDLAYSYNRANNRLSSITGTGTSGKYGNIQYDARGNIKHNGAFGLSYNAANQMVSAKGNTFLYDGHNRRVKQVEAKGTSYSFYSQDGTLLYREKGDTLTGEGINYIYLGEKLIAKTGNVIPISTADSRQHYRPFGETLEEAKDDVGYTGHKFDKELGLSYMQARYYDPVIGRFYSNDPVDAATFISQGNIQGFNRFAYANNNPYKYVDPDGKTPIEQIEQAIKDSKLIETGGDQEKAHEMTNQELDKMGDAALEGHLIMAPSVAGIKVAGAIAKSDKVKDVVEAASTAVEFGAQVVTVVTSLTGNPSGDVSKPDSLGSGRGPKARAELKVNTKRIKTSVLRNLGDKKSQ